MVKLILAAYATAAAVLPHLGPDGIGSVRFGASRQTVIAALQPSLGRPNATGINTGCGKSIAEVAWHDLIVEFRSGRFSGYRFVRGGWPLTTPGSPSDRVPSTTPIPPLRTQSGITLGTTLRRLRAVYPTLARAGAVHWRTRDGLVFTEPSTARNLTSPANTIVEIQAGTCGDF
jgi:hypothetical protein